MNAARRRFLQSTGLSFLALGWPPSFLLRLAAAQQTSQHKSLVVVFQRGAMDGLNAVIPFKDSGYYAARPTLAIAEPASGTDHAIDLDGFYALHPALASLKELYTQGHLAIVHAVGSPDNTRSHFDAQDYMELGTPGVKSTPDGWLNRYLNARRTGPSYFRAVATTAQLPRILTGAVPALTLSSIDEFRPRNEVIAGALEKLYASSADPLFRRGGESLFGALRELREIEAKIPPSDGNYPSGRFAMSLAQVSRLIKSGVGLEVAFTEIEGWDTHVNQGGATGQMANRLKELADGLAAFYRDLGDKMSDVVVLTMSEFGRTVRENGNGGTDHGHANVMFVLGGAVRGGKVYGRWPGLAQELLYEGRDLELTTDYRAVCGEVIARHLGRRDLTKIFPGFRLPKPLDIIA
ncbi:MAG TPA: DUF1501 domain-containing protein [Candidatus Binatia bacterium]|nr:DUF1501 domain-containing protein [Candidatus Binatia bacterium]